MGLHFSPLNRGGVGERLTGRPAVTLRRSEASHGGCWLLDGGLWRWALTC